MDTFMHKINVRFRADFHYVGDAEAIAATALLNI
jgi:hypothetical protein